MASVQIKRVIEKARCCWCGKEREVVDAVFSDKSFDGPLCWHDFRNAARLKTGPTVEKGQDPPDQFTKERL